MSLTATVAAQNLDGFSANVVAKFFSFLPGPPALWTLSAAATQIFGAALLAIGVFSRPVAASMSATMAAARHASETSAPLGWPRHPPLGLSREAMLSPSETHLCGIAPTLLPSPVL